MKTIYLPALFLLSFFCCNGKKDVSNQVINGIAGTADVNNTKLYYEVIGEGQPIIFIHGNGGDRRHWDFQFIPLSKEYKVIRYDVRGYGKSALPNPEESYSDYEDLKALLDYLRISKAHICGLSMGSGIAVDFAIVYPEKCISLIPVGPWVNGYQSPSTQEVFDSMDQLPSIINEKGIKEAVDFWLEGNDVFAKSFQNSTTVEKMKTIGYDYSFWGFLNVSKRQSLQPPTRDRLNEIRVPTLIITAENDLQACLEIADLLENEIQGAKKISIKNAGHCMNIDEPEQFNELVTDFIQGIK